MLALNALVGTRPGRLLAVSMITRDDEPRSGTQAVERALAILGCFRDGPDELGVSEIATRLGLRVSTAHRIVRALCNARYLEQDPVSERYRLGRELAVLGQRAMRQLGFDLVEPALAALAADTGESASLGVWQEGAVLVAVVVASDQPLRFDHPRGSLVPAHASAMGKAMLAHVDERPEDALALLRSLARFTPRTITSKRRLGAELDEVRARGYALNQEERYPGVVGIAAPVLDERGRARAAVGVQGPAVRVRPERVSALGRRLQEAAATVAELLPLHRL